MGYTTDFEGRIEIDPPLNEKEIAYLCDFASTRHMDRANGPYFVDGSYGHSNESDVHNYNKPHSSQPGLWCHWMPTEDGTALEWDDSEKFYESAAWMQYIMDHFICSTPAAAYKMPFLQGHVCNGSISAQGEDPSDMWLLEVKDNRVSVQDLVPTPDGDPIPVATDSSRMLTRAEPLDRKSVLPESGNG